MEQMQHLVLCYKCYIVNLAYLRLIPQSSLNPRFDGGGLTWVRFDSIWNKVG